MLTNNKIKFIKSLSLKKNRYLNGLFVVEGVKNVQEFINSDYHIDSIYSTSEWEGKSIQISEKDLCRISSLKSPNMVLALVRIPEKVKEITGDLILALDRIQDPGNFGTIIRLSDWYGVDGIICSTDCVDQYNSKVVQASMGSISRVKIHYCDLHSKIQKMEDYNTVAMVLGGENINQINIKGKKIIMLGNEGEGLSQDLIDISNYKSSIVKSRNSKAESLNVANASAIALHLFS